MFDAYSENKTSVRKPNESTFVARYPSHRYFEVRVLTRQELVDHLKNHEQTPVQIHKFGNDEYIIEYFKESEVK